MLATRRTRRPSAGEAAGLVRRSIELAGMGTLNEVAGLVAMARAAVEWAGTHPDDPRVPESLHLGVRSAHLGKGSGGADVPDRDLPKTSNYGTRNQPMAGVASKTADESCTMPAKPPSSLPFVQLRLPLLDSKKHDAAGKRNLTGPGRSHPADGHRGDTTLSVSVGCRRV